MSEQDPPPAAWDWRTWVTVGLGNLCMILGVLAGLTIGVSVGIWLEGGDPLKEFILAAAGPGKISLARGVGLVAGGALGGGLTGFVALTLLRSKRGPRHKVPSKK